MIKEKIEDIKTKIEVYFDYHEPLWFPPYRKWKSEWEKQNIYDDYEKMWKHRKARIRKQVREIKQMEKKRDKWERRINNDTMPNNSKSITK